jgi:hypothetical protein
MIGISRITRKDDLIVTTVSYNSYKLNAQLKQNIKKRLKLKDKEHG